MFIDPNRCFACGKEFRHEDENYCHDCGAVRIATNACKNCGISCELGDRYCVRCGSETETYDKLKNLSST